MIKIGILTYHRARNYGAFLQAAALCKRLNQEKDIKAEIIDYNMKSAEDSYSSYKRWPISRKIKHFPTYLYKCKLENAFIRGRNQIKDIISSGYLCTNSIVDFQKFVRGKYDIIISGSDEIWKIDGIRGFPTPYWLCGDLECRKFSYAASSRSEFDKLDHKNYSILSEALNDYEFISVRDKATYNEVTKIVKPENVIISCDPSFLYTFKVSNKEKAFAKLRNKLLYDPRKKNIVVMIDDKNLLETIKNQLGENCNLITVFKRFKGYLTTPDLDPFEWLSLISNADFIISSYFHGVCFSIANKKPFCAIGTPERKSKLDDLLLNSELDKYYYQIEDAYTLDWINAINNNIDCSQYESFLDSRRDNFDIFLQRIKV